MRVHAWACRLRWIGIATASIVINGCAPVEEIIAPSVCVSPPLALAYDIGAVLPGGKKAALLKLLTDRSSAPSEDTDEGVRVRQAGFLLSLRRLADDGYTLDRELAEVQDSLSRIPGLLASVTSTEAMLRLGRARNEARRNAREAQSMATTMADSVDYYALLDAVASAVSDTSVTGGEMYPIVASIAAAATTSFPADTNFAAWVHETAIGSDVVREATESGIVYAWIHDSMTGPEYALSREGCTTVHGEGAKTVEWPAWIKSAAKFVATTVVGSAAVALRNGAAVGTAIAQGLEGGLIGAGVVAAAGWTFDAIMAIEHEIRLSSEVCARSAFYGRGCPMLREKRASLLQVGLP
jgi:hypothetical protein